MVFEGEDFFVFFEKRCEVGMEVVVCVWFAFVGIVIWVRFALCFSDRGFYFFFRDVYGSGV